MVELKQKSEFKENNLESKLCEISSGALLFTAGAVLGYATIESVPYLHDFMETNFLNDYLLAQPHKDAIVSLSSYVPALVGGLASFGLMCLGIEQFSKKNKEYKHDVKFYQNNSSAKYE